MTGTISRETGQKTRRQIMLKAIAIIAAISGIALAAYAGFGKCSSYGCKCGGYYGERTVGWNGACKNCGHSYSAHY
jgi:TRAP-type C4-dicarboxylate transport system permease large subunit